MQFLANENFPFPSVKLLRQNGHRVDSIRETQPGITDNEVIETAKANSLIILTFDKDYGEIIFKYNSQAPPAVVYFRDKGVNPVSAAITLIELIGKGISFDQCFTVIDKDNVRQRKY
jgi:predicted nuclease of predicted toxin-antitoxin system